MLTFPITIYQNKINKQILIYPRMGNAVIFDDGTVQVLGSGLIAMDWLNDENEKKKWKILVKLE